MLGVGVSGCVFYFYILEVGEMLVGEWVYKWFFGCPKMGNQVRVCDGMWSKWGFGRSGIKVEIP